MERSLTRREAWGVWLLALVLALVMTAPVVLHLGSRIPDSLEDPLLQAWEVAWGGHALLHSPLHLFDANAFWPAHNSLAFSDSLLGYSPAGLIGSGPHAALVRYNLLYLFAYVLAFAAAWLLARELGLGRVGAAVTGGAFAYAPWRASQAGHLHVLSSGGIALTLYLLLRGYRRRSPAFVVAGWLAAAWQVSLGFSLGLPLLYLLLVLAPLIAWHEWKRRADPGVSRMIAASICGALLLAAVSVALAVPYIHARDHNPEVQRSQTLVKAFSPRPLSYLAAPVENVVWGARTIAVRDHLYTPGHFAPVDEKTLFPGLTVILLAALGIFRGALPRRLRTALGAAALLSGLFALGLSLGALSPYRLLYDYAPGWDAIRTPGRLATVLTLVLAVLAGAGADTALEWLRARRRFANLRAPALAIAIPFLVLFEGWAPPETRQVPAEPPGFAAIRAPALHLPTNRFVDSTYMYWSTDGFHPIVNGWSSFDTAYLTRVRAATTGSQLTPAAAALLRGAGVRWVIRHTSDRAPVARRISP